MNSDPRGSLSERASKAIETARAALRYLSLGAPLVHKEPGGGVRVDIPLMYNGFAIDRVHFDPLLMSLSPKGRPVRVYGDINIQAVTRFLVGLLGELEVFAGAEYREPENAWAVPIVWRNLIVAHIKIRDGNWRIVPDYALTEELRRRVV